MSIRAQNICIRVVDDEPDVAEVLVNTLGFIGRPGAMVLSADEAITADYGPDDILFLDLNMPGKDGLQVLRELSSRGQYPSIVLISGVDSRLLQAALNFGKVAGFNRISRLQKPFSFDSLNEAISLIESGRPVPARRQAARAIPKRADTAPAGEFFPYFQPKFVIETGELKGFEALMRWIPQGADTVFGPGDFLDDIRQCERMEELTFRIIEVGLEALESWQQKFSAVTCAFNFEASLLGTVTADWLSEACSAHGIDPRLVVVELTEREVLANRSLGLESLTRLRLRGFQLSMDDFGTGYSSLNRLSQYPFTELKLDVGFVSRIGRDKDIDAITRESIALAHQLGMHVCAEGVEHVDQLAWLSNAGCDMAQGYLLGRPMSGADAGALLAAHASGARVV
jgi:EAL domain-containing protein (putative c-di-GMP-specific phosphodiesterase class I)